MKTAAIYADHNAQSPLRPEARAAAERAMALSGNPSSVHAAGRRAKALLDEARDNVAASVGARPADVVFTSGAAEANNFAVKCANADVVFLSALEHDSVWTAAHASGKRVEIIPAQASGCIDVEWLRSRLENWNAQLNGVPLVCVMLANNETGVVQPVQGAAGLAHRAGGYLLCDAVQALGRINIDIENFGADYLSLSSHKIGGLAGSGALVVRGNTPIAPLIHGGGQEQGRRAGTENLIGAVALGAACAASNADAAESVRVRVIRDSFESALRLDAPDTRIVGGDANRLGNTSCVAAPGVSAETIVVAMDMAGIACSAGAACSSGKVQPSRALLAMGIPEHEVKSAVRFSFGWNSGAEDGVKAADAYVAIIRRLREQRAA